MGFFLLFVTSSGDQYLGLLHGSNTALPHGIVSQIHAPRATAPDHPFDVEHVGWARNAYSTASALKKSKFRTGQTSCT